MCDRCRTTTDRPANAVISGVGGTPYAQAQAVAEKQYAADQQDGAKAAVGTGSSQPLLHRIIRLYQQSSGDVERLGRMHALLVKHPEFDDFLELQDLMQLHMIRR